MDSGTSVTRLDPDSGERFQPLRRDLGVTSFGMNLITLQPGERGRVHEHVRQEEVMLVLEGILDVLTPDGVVELHANDVMRIAPDVRRQLVNRGPGRTVVVALGGSNEHDGRDGRAFASFDDAEAKAPQDLPNPEPLPASDLRG
jgi:uncharacterized cupin superfamily protein